MGLTFPNESREYRAARDQLLMKEVELRRAMEAVAAERRKLPPGGAVPEDYVFDGLGSDGRPARVKLSELFGEGKDTLVIYNFMFPRHAGDPRPGPASGATARLKLEEGPCPSCTALIDQFNGAAEHLEQNLNFVIVAKAPIERVVALAKDRSWKHLRVLSSAGNNFKRDYHAETPQGLMPMMTVFHRKGGEIRHFWSSEMAYEKPDVGQDARENGTVEPLWTIFDLTPGGRPAWQEQLQYDRPAAHDKPMRIQAAERR